MVLFVPTVCQHMPAWSLCCSRGWGRFSVFGRWGIRFFFGCLTTFLAIEWCRNLMSNVIMYNHYSEAWNEQSIDFKDVGSPCCNQRCVGTRLNVWTTRHPKSQCIVSDSWSSWRLWLFIHQQRHRFWTWGTANTQFGWFSKLEPQTCVIYSRHFWHLSMATYHESSHDETWDIHLINLHYPCSFSKLFDN